MILKPDDAAPETEKTWKLLYEASSHEVTELSNVVASLREQIHHMGRTLNKWEERFDRLLELKR